MTEFETGGPISMRGEEPWRRAGRTILSRGEIGERRPVPLSRTERQGLGSPAVAEALRQSLEGEPGGFVPGGPSEEQVAAASGGDTIELEDGLTARIHKKKEEQ